ncbi:MAG: ATP-dependent DNA helicase, partial [Thermoprotei archaeon]
MDIGDIWPYDSWRAGQRRIAEAVRNSVLEGVHLMVSYPTGAGKTAAALTGALVASLSEGFKVLYLVRTRTQFQAPLRELRAIAERVELDAVFLQNKRDMCLIKGVQLLPYDEFLRFCGELVRSGLCPYYRRASEIDISLEGLLSPEELLTRAIEA